MQLDLTLLFARQRTPAACTCDRPGYCAACGAYTPGGDPEVRAHLDRESRPPNVAKRVVRKYLGSAD